MRERKASQFLRRFQALSVAYYGIHGPAGSSPKLVILAGQFEGNLDSALQLADRNWKVAPPTRATQLRQII